MSSSIALKLLIILQLHGYASCKDPMIDLTTAWSITPPEDIQMEASHQASCLKTLLAHANHLLTTVKDIRGAINHFVPEETTREFLHFSVLSAEHRQRDAGCPKADVGTQVQVRLLPKEGRFMPAIRLQSLVHLDLSEEDDMPPHLFHGSVDGDCIVGVPAEFDGLHLLHVELTVASVQPVLSMDQSVVEFVDWGKGQIADSVFIEVVGKEVVELFVNVFCQRGRRHLPPIHNTIRSDVSVQEVRDLLAHLRADFGHQSRGSFMVAAFHPHGFKATKPKP